MADRILKPDSGNDLVLQNDDASAKIEINEDGSMPVTGTLEGSMTVGSGKTLNVSSGTFTTSSAQKQAIVQAGPGSGTLDVSSGTFTTSSAQKTAIVDGGKGNLAASDVGLGNVTNESKATMFTSPTFTGTPNLGSNPTVTLGTNTTFPSGSVLQNKVLAFSQAVSAISTNSTSFTDSGIAGSFTTIKSSSDSFFILKCYRGMTHQESGGGALETTFAVTTSNNTTYAVGNNVYQQTYRNYQQTTGSVFYMPNVISGIFKVGTVTPTSKTSYSAGETLYIRMFFNTSNAAHFAYFLHAGSHVILTVEEILL